LHIFHAVTRNVPVGLVLAILFTRALYIFKSMKTNLPEIVSYWQIRY